jgi:hypothetical protein
MDQHYTRCKISLAMDCLVSGDKLLRERVADAVGCILIATHRIGLEQQYETILKCIESVQNGDYSQAQASHRGRHCLGKGLKQAAFLGCAGE